MVGRKRGAASQRSPQQRPQQRGDRQPRGDSDRPRAPRKCANCGKKHEARICPHPAIPRKQRACWTCGKQAHSNKDCPSKPQRSAVKAIEDQLPFVGGAFAVADVDGYRQPRRPGRPQPRGATLGDFVIAPTRNRFAGMERDVEPTTATTIRSRPATRTTANRNQPDIVVVAWR